MKSYQALHPEVDVVWDENAGDAVLETEAGQARALAKLDTIKEDVVWWSAGAETPRLLTDGQHEDQFALSSWVVVRAPRCLGQ